VLKPKRKIKIGYQDVNINLISFDKEVDHVFGEYDSVKNTIDLNKTQAPRSMANSLLHEVVHAVIYETGLNSDGNCLSNDKDEELAVNAITNSLSQIIRDNKWFLPYIQKNIHSGAKSNEETGVKVLSRNKKSVAKRTLSTNRNKRRARRS